ncbi:hypothetical protein Q5752_002205 [Cryptotrichosporon argae]
MFCLRKRAPLPSRSEALARLRPPARDRDAVLEDAPGSMASPFAPITASTASTSSAASSRPSTSADVGFDPFEYLRAALAPYSIIYVRGTPEGVVGRYMEELEADDGQRDFGHLSRGADEATRRRAGEGMIEWLDWADHGALLHLPLTSLFAPLLNLPENISRVLAPSYNLLSAYASSFSDGSQRRALRAFADEAARGGAVDVLRKVREHHLKKAQRIREEREKMRSEKESAGAGSVVVEGKGVGKGEQGERE